LILALAGILSTFDKLIRNFLWKGGRHNENKIPLVSWEKVTKLYQEGSVQIKDMKVQILALGAKILWRQVTGKMRRVK